ncbi:hypothetical protein AB434_1249 [Heyndrickxia coagulans]|uniref:Glutamyl-tRNA synthetase n=1 Tax=Heyndrickxia coagulans TaxID=1398 RepID=A0AAN0WDR1_HEYCO|nr:glutamyl-tRNA synthetase [Heyndrickxia coagulans]AKN53654.1 hypothetical protein AB434_1249 [Heyndrickxia coagulans]
MLLPFRLFFSHSPSVYKISSALHFHQPDLSSDLQFKKEAPLQRTETLLDRAVPLCLAAGLARCPTFPVNGRPRCILLANAFRYRLEGAFQKRRGLNHFQPAMVLSLKRPLPTSPSQRFFIHLF